MVIATQVVQNSAYKPSLSPGGQTLGLMGLSPNTISAAIIEFWPEPLQNFSAYILYKPQNLFSNSVTKFHDFVTKAYSATNPYVIIEKFYHVLLNKARSASMVLFRMDFF